VAQVATKDGIKPAALEISGSPLLPVKTVPGSVPVQPVEKVAVEKDPGVPLVLATSQEHFDVLKWTILQPLGFDDGRPVAAMLIFRCASSSLVCLKLSGASSSLVCLKLSGVPQAHLQVCLK
jgi:hypothetical protein